MTNRQRTVEASALKDAEQALKRHGILTEEISSRIQDAIRKIIGNDVCGDLKPPHISRTTKTAKTLRFLLGDKEGGQHVSQRELLREIYGTEELSYENLRKLKVLISRVREKIAGMGVIIFEHGRGYTLYADETKIG